MNNVKHAARHFSYRSLMVASVAGLTSLAFASVPVIAQQNRQSGQQAQQSGQQGQSGQQAQQANQQSQQSGKQAQGSGSNTTRPNALVIILRDAADGNGNGGMSADQRAQDVTPQDLYRGVRASNLMGQEVFGGNGNEVGNIQDIFAGPDNRVKAIVVEGGGFLGIGDAAFRVSWDEVNLTPGTDGVRIKMTEQTAENYDLFDGPETLATGQREYRLSEVIGDYSRLSSGEGYGRVSDVVIGRDGKLHGVLVTRNRSLGGGMYGYPYYGYGYGFNPGNDYYALPYASADEAVQGVPRIDARRFEQGTL